MNLYQEVALQRSNSTRKCIIPYERSTSTSTRSVSFSIPESDHNHPHSTTANLLVRSVRSDPPPTFFRVHSRVFALIRSLFSVITLPNIIPTTCKWLSIPNPVQHLSITPSLGRKVTGTLFGNRRGYVSFAIQDDPRSEPVLLLEFAMSTATLVKEMASGLVRIALECEKGLNTVRTGWLNRSIKLFNEPKWTMHCNGKKCGYAMSRRCGGSDVHVLSNVARVSVGAGVIPVVADGRKICSEGELVYMRAKFERVVGSRDSEAFYMLNPDHAAGPELSIFLLRI
ncbi:hypothetical protein ACFE04_031042 [Oxalis oulophora]